MRVRDGGPLSRAELELRSRGPIGAAGARQREALPCRESSALRKRPGQLSGFRQSVSTSISKMTSRVGLSLLGVALVCVGSSLGCPGANKAPVVCSPAAEKALSAGEL